MSGDPWSHDADMSGAAWERRTHRVQPTPHAESWRDQERAQDQLTTVRGLMTALGLAVLCWLVFGGLAWWAIETFVGAQ